MTRRNTAQHQMIRSHRTRHEILRTLSRAAAPLCFAASLLLLGGHAQERSHFAIDSTEQQKAVAETMRQNSSTLSLKDSTLRGPGMDFLTRSTANAQFVLFGEEHNVKEFPPFLTAFFAYLHQQRGFNYLAVESDPISAHVASLPPLRGNTEALAGYATKYPNAFTFLTDQEVQMFADVSRLSRGRADPSWGLDQSFGVLHALDRLSALPGFHSSPKFAELHQQAGQSDLTRPGGDYRDFMETVKLAELQELRRQMNAPEGSEASFILDNLVSSSQIYGHYREGEFYDNGFEREEQMKNLFLRGYRAAEAKGEPQPKVLLKLGHWHMYRGQGPSRLQTLGNFVTEFATANGSEAFVIGVYLRGPWRDVANRKGLEPLAMATDPGAWTLIDFRPLRQAAAAGQFGALNPNLLREIYGFDAALVFGPASAGTDTLVPR